jgi:hypothetical protein
VEVVAETKLVVKLVVLVQLVVLVVEETTLVVLSMLVVLDYSQAKQDFLVHHTVLVALVEVCRELQMNPTQVVEAVALVALANL